MKIDLEKAIRVFRDASAVKTAYLCGSYAQDTETRRSDLDFAFLSDKKMSMMEETQLQASLSESLSFEDIDLVNLHRAPTRLQFNLVSTGKLIYERDQGYTDDYMEQLLKQYHAKMHMYRTFQEDLEAGLREDYGR